MPDDYGRITREYERTADDYERLATDTDDYERLRSLVNDYEQLSKRKQNILLYLLDNNKITRKEAEDLIDFKATKTSKTITEMLKSNLLAKKGKGKNTHYILNPKIHSSTK